jgi:hypothetical protein
MATRPGPDRPRVVIGLAGGGMAMAAEMGRGRWRQA